MQLRDHIRREAFLFICDTGGQIAGLNGDICYARCTVCIIFARCTDLPYTKHAIHHQMYRAVVSDFFPLAKKRNVSRTESLDLAPALPNCHPTGRFQAISSFLRIKDRNVRDGERARERGGDGEMAEERLCPHNSFSRVIYYGACFPFSSPRAINCNFVINHRTEKSWGERVNAVFRGSIMFWAKPKWVSYPRDILPNSLLHPSRYFISFFRTSVPICRRNYQNQVTILLCVCVCHAESAKAARSASLKSQPVAIRKKISFRAPERLELTSALVIRRPL